jgi:phage shock protein E
MAVRQLRYAWLAVLLAVTASVAVADEPASAPEAGDAEDVVWVGEPVPPSLLRSYLADDSAFTLIDARSEEEYAEKHVDGAVNIPHDDVESHAERLPASLDDTVVVYCRTGRRASLLQSEISERGYTDVRVLRPEQISWNEERGKFNCGDGRCQ